MHAVASAARGLYPDGWTAHLNSYPFSDLSPSMDWELVCQAAGGYGERVEDPAEVPAALERALRVVQQEQGRERLAHIAAQPAKPGQETILAKLQEWKAKLKSTP